jgi:Ycf66 protein N-terminus
VSFGIPAALLFGLVLILASLALFLTSKFKPDLYQESDNIYAVIGIICGLLLLISLDLGAAMAFQQLLMIGSLITIMWQFMQVRAENRRLKGGGRSAGRESPTWKSGYSAQIDDEPEYSPAKRGNRRTKDRFDRTNNEREDREELPSRRSATRELPENQFAEIAPRRRRNESARPETSSLARRQNDSWDDEDWNNEAPVQVRRALPDADLASQQSERRSPRRRPERPEMDDPDRNLDNNNDDPGSAPRRRRPRPDTSGDGNERVASASSTRQRPESSSKEGTTANYVDYEPIDPPSGLPPGGSEPIVFPDRY